MKQFIKKADKVSAFQFHEIFPMYKEIQELTGIKWKFQWDKESGFIRVENDVQNGHSISIRESQILIIYNSKVDVMDKKAFDATYEEINKEKIIIKEIFNDKPPFTNPFPLIPGPLTPNQPYPLIPNQPYL